jgi:pyridoxine/pyridoxamine 5'-phosphate oxidase
MWAAYSLDGNFCLAEWAGFRGRFGRCSFWLEQPVNLPDKQEYHKSNDQKFNDGIQKHTIV